MARDALTAVADSNQTISGLVKGVTRNFQVLEVKGDKVKIEIHTATSGSFEETVSEKDIILPGEESDDSRPRDSRYYDEEAAANLKAQSEDNEKAGKKSSKVTSQTSQNAKSQVSTGKTSTKTSKSSS